MQDVDAAFLERKADDAKGLTFSGAFPRNQPKASTLPSRMLRQLTCVVSVAAGICGLCVMATPLPAGADSMLLTALA